MAWRLGMGLTQRSLAEKLSLSRSSVQDFERGYRLQKPHTISDESWERLKAACLFLQAGLYMTDEWKVVGLMPARTTRKTRELSALKASAVARAKAARR